MLHGLTYLANVLHFSFHIKAFVATRKHRLSFFHIWVIRRGLVFNFNQGLGYSLCCWLNLNWSFDCRNIAFVNIIWTITFTFPKFLPWAVKFRFRANNILWGLFRDRIDGPNFIRWKFIVGTFCLDYLWTRFFSLLLNAVPLMFVTCYFVIENFYRKLLFFAALRSFKLYWLLTTHVDFGIRHFLLLRCAVCHLGLLAVGGIRFLAFLYLLERSPGWWSWL